MSELKYSRAERFLLQNHPDFTEKWVQTKIFDDPSILGLGNLIPLQMEKIQPGAGRLDILLQDENEETQYEVEIQLGKTNESHIIRCLEYWDLERKRNPGVDHVAVLVAEDITSRFYNVINLFNGAIPLIAIKVEAIKLEDKFTLIFTKVLDHRSLRDSQVSVESVNRNYWEKRATKKTVELADALLEMVKKLDPGLELKYNKFYIGLAHDGQPYNFMIFRPKKTFIRMEVKLPESPETTDVLEKAGIELLEYSSRNGCYVLRLTKEDIDKNYDLLFNLAKQAFTDFGGDALDE